MITTDDARIEATHRAIRAYWDCVGPSDSDVIAFLINPQFMDQPSWPNMRQAYRVVRARKSLIIASDGLSDPFVGTDIEDTNGFGMEVFVETPDLVGADFKTISDSWAFKLVENFAMNVANWGGIAPQLRQQGVMSTEFPSEGLVPADWLTASGTAGFLINAPVLGRALEVTDTPIAPVLVVALTLLRPKELEFVAQGGGAARRELVARLTAAGTGHLCSLARPSVV